MNMDPFKSTSFLDYTFKALYFIFFKEPVNNCLP